MCLVAFAELKKATVSFVISVRPSVRLRLSVNLSALMEKFLSYYKNFHNIWYLRTFRKSAKKISH